jgi:hypothetical protein
MRFSTGCIAVMGCSWYPESETPSMYLLGEVSGLFSLNPGIRVSSLDHLPLLHHLQRELSKVGLELWCSLALKDSDPFCLMPNPDPQGHPGLLHLPHLPHPVSHWEHSTVCLKYLINLPLLSTHNHSFSPIFSCLEFYNCFLIGLPNSWSHFLLSIVYVQCETSKHKSNYITSLIKMLPTCHDSLTKHMHCSYPEHHFQPFSVLFMTGEHLQDDWAVIVTSFGKPASYPPT